jgi:hypothetical protein
MKDLTLGLATAGTLAAAIVGLAVPASAAVAATADPAVYATQTHGAATQPVDCHVHVNYQGSDVDVNWC